MCLVWGCPIFRCIPISCLHLRQYLEQCFLLLRNGILSQSLQTLLVINNLAFNVGGIFSLRNDRQVHSLELLLQLF